MLIAHVLHATDTNCYGKRLQNLFHCNCGLQICQIWIQLITACGKYCERWCTRHASLIWSYQRRHWRMAAAMTTWSSLAYSVLKHYSGEVKNVYTILQQIYSGKCVPNFIRIARVLWKILQKTFSSLFFWTHCIYFKYVNVFKQSQPKK